MRNVEVEQFQLNFFDINFFFIFYDFFDFKAKESKIYVKIIDTQIN